MINFVLLLLQLIISTYCVKFNLLTTLERCYCHNVLIFLFDFRYSDFSLQNGADCSSVRSENRALSQGDVKVRVNPDQVSIIIVFL